MSKFKPRIHNALVENGVEYDHALELVNYQPKRALNLLNKIKKSKKHEKNNTTNTQS